MVDAVAPISSQVHGTECLVLIWYMPFDFEKVHLCGVSAVLALPGVAMVLLIVVNNDESTAPPGQVR